MKNSFATEGTEITERKKREAQINAELKEVIREFLPLIEPGAAEPQPHDGRVFLPRMEHGWNTDFDCWQSRVVGQLDRRRKEEFGNTDLR
jgi:hypothetical protein